MASPPSADPSSGTHAAASPGGLTNSRWYALAVLTMVGSINWADRQVVPILFPGIRKDLGLSDTELGIIGGLAFSIIYAISALAFGYAADRHLRKRIILVGLVLWSAATAAGGLATGFWSLFAARFFTGIGEASLYPCALSLIGERFAAAERGKAVGIFNACAAIGGGLGIGLGGGLAEKLGWQRVFFVYGAAGLLMIPLLLSLGESRRSRTQEEEESTTVVVRELLADRRLRWIWATGTLAIICGQGFAAWGPSYFVRDLSFDVTQAGAVFGSAGLFGGVLGGVLGGSLADRRKRLRVGGEFEVVAAFSFVACVLMGVLLLSGQGLLAIGSGVIATLSIYALFPGLLAAMLTIVPQKRHGVAAALNTIFLGGVGAASGPFVVGALSDGLGSLHVALFFPTVGLGLVAGFALMTGGLSRRSRAQRAGVVAAE